MKNRKSLSKPFSIAAAAAWFRYLDLEHSFCNTSTFVWSTAFAHSLTGSSGCCLWGWWSAEQNNPEGNPNPISFLFQLRNARLRLAWFSLRYRNFLTSKHHFPSVGNFPHTWLLFRKHWITHRAVKMIWHEKKCKIKMETSLLPPSSCTKFSAGKRTPHKTATAPGISTTQRAGQTRHKQPRDADFDGFLRKEFRGCRALFSKNAEFHPSQRS